MCDSPVFYYLCIYYLYNITDLSGRILIPVYLSSHQNSGAQKKRYIPFLTLS